MQKIELSGKQRDYIIRAVVLLVLLAVTAVIIALAVNGRLFGSEADEAYDTIYSHTSDEETSYDDDNPYDGYTISMPDESGEA